MTRSVLAIDAGQTGMKVRVDTPDGRDELLFRGIDTHEPLLPQLAEVVRASLTRTHASPDVVAAGISGLTDRDADADALLALVAGTGIRSAALAHDSTTSFLGALGDRHGAVVASGTGVVTLAVGARDVARVDGWGYIMGDAGSGYWIGREALDAVMRAYDGRGPATALTDVVCELWPDLSQAYIALQGDEGRVRIVAGFAASVARCADAGDAVALAITARAARELAHSVSTAIARVRGGETETFAVCTVGGVFRSAPLRAAFADALTDGGRRGDVEIVAPRGAGIDGVVALPGLAPSHPLTAAVHRAGIA
ncbi:N-acetylglucosamine kinase [Microbacterium telephonicum]|uniref:N-acetylglucosamine kinase-like BadF-type ATPase n=1 Tax=Microbacterium telephonicum TaxID=1714841 RepID=A0A498C036_9MICO|nr:BadF/BadG/BcrA/BcrD ATPase family protein [Microbacterium telephonicum]RLK47856.1 N-acetylglucosamine kinase-like BadF-type ATPase [Microbacterium telephonicum]